MQNYIEWVGYAAGALTTFSFLPQVLKTYRNRNAKDLSLPMFAIYFLGICLWLSYGLLIGEWPIIVPNVVSLLLSGVMLYFKLKY